MSGGFQAYGSGEGFVGGFGGGGAPKEFPLTLNPAVFLLGSVGVLNGSDAPASNGEAVKTWQDQSGNGDSARDATNGAAGSRPVFTAANAAFNNKPTVTSTSAKWLASGSMGVTINQAFTVFLVGVPTGDSVLISDVPADDAILVYGAVGVWREYAGASVVSALSSNTPAVAIAVFDGASARFYLNALTAQAGNCGAGNMGAGYTILNDGTHVGGGATLAEVAIYSGAMSDANAKALMAYGGAKYAIAIGA